MLSQVIEYAKISIISLEQDVEKVESEIDSLDDWDSDEMKDLELEQVSLNSQIMGIRQILNYCRELDKSVTNGVK